MYGPYIDTKAVLVWSNNPKVNDLRQSCPKSLASEFAYLNPQCPDYIPLKTMWFRCSGLGFPDILKTHT